MNRRIGSKLFGLALILSAPVGATTWGPQQVPDPIKPGGVCQVSVPASYGSYIYNWPSKYDQVFWPLTDAHGIWFCASSGFVAFIGDFKDMSDADRAKIAAYLAKNHKSGAEPELMDKLQRMEDLYALRTKDKTFQITLLRALAYLHEEHGDQAGATRLRHKALEEIRQVLAAEPGEQQRFEYLFVSAAYERKFGNDKASDEALKKLDAALASNKNEKLAEYVKYLTELKRDVPRIAPSGRLAPEPLDKKP